MDEDVAKNSIIADSGYLKALKDANDFYAESVVPFRENKLFKNLTNRKDVERVLLNAIEDKNKGAELEKLFAANEVQHNKKLSPTGTRKQVSIERIKKNTNDGESAYELKDVMADGLGKRGAKSNARARIRRENDSRFEKNYVDETKKTLDWLKRLESEERLFGTSDGDIKNYGMINLLKEISNSHLTDVYNPKLRDDLRKIIRPYARKQTGILEKNKKYRSSLANAHSNPNYYDNKYDLKRHVDNWPIVMGGGLGAGLGGMTGFPGPYLGGILGGGAGAYIKHSHSKKIFNAMTNEKFVDELIKMGRLPTKERAGFIKTIKLNPALKTEIIRLMFEKKYENTEQNNKQNN